MTNAVMNQDQENALKAKVESILIAHGLDFKIAKYPSRSVLPDGTLLVGEVNDYFNLVNMKTQLTLVKRVTQYPKMMKLWNWYCVGWKGLGTCYVLPKQVH